MTSKLKANSASSWLINKELDSVLVTKGSVIWVCVLSLVLFVRGDSELDIIDLVLSEFHLGATYDAIIRRKLYKTIPWEILFVPILIVAVTYILIDGGREIMVTTLLAYASIWHRGRQDFGVAAFYQKSAGGVVSSLHQSLFKGAIYLPMIAAVLFYTSYHPREYEGYPYYALPVGNWVAIGFGVVTLLWVVAYFIYVVPRAQVHRGEIWVVLSHILAFASAYVFGAWSAGFILVLGIHHEIQYMYFAYAIAKKRNKKPLIGVVAESKFFLLFLLWPIFGFISAMAQNRANIDWLYPLWVAVLICHYWLDSRIWNRRAFQKSLD